MRSWKIWLVASVCFLAAGVVDMVLGKYLDGALFLLLGIVYVYISASYHRKGDRPEPVRAVSDDVAFEVKKLIEEGKKYKAIKRYRTATGAGLKEASEYVDSLIERNPD